MIIAISGMTSFPKERLNKSFNKNKPPIVIRITEDFFSNLELTPMTNPIIIRIISHPKSHLGKGKFTLIFLIRRASPKNTMTAPTIFALLLFFGGMGGGVLKSFSITLYLNV